MGYYVSVNTTHKRINDAHQLVYTHVKQLSISKPTFILVSQHLESLGRGDGSPWDMEQSDVSFLQAFLQQISTQPSEFECHPHVPTRDNGPTLVWGTPPNAWNSTARCSL